MAEDLTDEKYYEPAQVAEHRAHVTDVITKFMLPSPPMWRQSEHAPDGNAPQAPRLGGDQVDAGLPAHAHDPEHEPARQRGPAGTVTTAPQRAGVAALGMACGPGRTRQWRGCTMSTSQCTFLATCWLTL